MIKIEKGVPVPVKQERKRKYPLAEMEVGDSFVAEGRGAKAAMSRYARDTGKKFISRAEGDMVRIWRKA